MITRRGFIASTAAATAAATVGYRTATAAAKPKRLIMVYLDGGWDISWSIDPKPGIVATPVDGVVETFADLPVLTHPATPAVGGFFADNADITAVVHGIYARSISHQTCERKMFTGTASGTGPDAAAMVANTHARDYAMPYLVTGNRAYSGPLGVITGRFGVQGQLNALVDPADAFPRQPAASNYHEGFEPQGGDEGRIRAYLEARAARERATRGQHGFNRARVDDFVESLEKGDLLKANADHFGSRGDDLSLIDQVGLALGALEEDLCWSVSIATGGFDTHENNDQQAVRQEELFAGLSLLANELRTRDLLDDTVVAVFSEMSRTPQLNAENGKDHHSVTSAMVFGGGVAGGTAYGANDDDVQGEPVDFATGEVDRDNGQYIDASNWVAGVVELAGGDASEYLPNADPFTAFIG